MTDKLWLDGGKQCTTTDDHLEVMNTEFQKMRSKLIKNFTKKQKVTMLDVKF